MIVKQLLRIFCLRVCLNGRRSLLLRGLIYEKQERTRRTSQWQEQTPRRRLSCIRMAKTPWWVSVLNMESEIAWDFVLGFGFHRKALHNPNPKNCQSWMRTAAVERHVSMQQCGIGNCVQLFWCFVIERCYVSRCVPNNYTDKVPSVWKNCLSHGEVRSGSEALPQEVFQVYGVQQNTKASALALFVSITVVGALDRIW